MKRKENVVFLIARGSVEYSPKKLYQGIGVMKLEGFNPPMIKVKGVETKAVYTGSYSRDGEDIKYVRINAMLKSVPELNHGINFSSRVSFILADKYQTNHDDTKVKVIDDYGNTAWVTKDQAAKKEVPIYANGPANIDNNYRPCLIGEENLIDFVKKYLCIPDRKTYKDGKWVLNDRVNAKDCIVKFDHIKDFFNNDFAELNEIPTYQPNNTIKVLFGIKTIDGKSYQDAMDRVFAKGSSHSVHAFEKELTNMEQSGRSGLTLYKICDLAPFEEENQKQESTDLFESNGNTPLNTDEPPF